ncbi:MAG: endopeptidase La [Desulfobacterales bacterium]|jgi:ATP-dependent Lon protease
MVGFLQPLGDKKAPEDIPQDLPILPLRNTVAFPFMILPLAVGVPRSIKLVEDAMHGNRLVGLVASKDPELDEPVPGQTYTVGTVARVLRVVRGSDKDLQMVVENLERFKILHWQKTEPYLQAHIELAPDLVQSDIELDALVHSLRELAKQVVALMPNLPAEVGNFLDQVQEPRYLFYMVTSNSRMDIAECQRILEMDDLKDKYRAVIAYLTRQKEILTLGQKIQSDAREKMGKAQREYYLRQQLKAIREELGEAEETTEEAVEYAARIEKAVLPEEAKKEALRELKRLKIMAPQAAEYAVIKTYLDWLLDLPWEVLSEDRLDINHARTVLDEDHYDLQEVKDRVIEFLAVRKLVLERGLETKAGEDEKAGEAMGAILCFVGPPGVGKTSLGQSIARALGRKFTRMSLGGMRDEAEIRGHRRTYIGAMPGRIIQAIKRAGTRNPVFMLDEVDKIGTDWRGDPSSALLEVLDPAQNHAFRDHYLDVDFDLSDVMFITTANQLETIPAPLRDRMEVIQLDGYTEYEKIHIARNFLIPRQLKANGLLSEEISLDADALRKIIQDYTREAGVRTLERQIGSIFRKIVVKIAGGDITRHNITTQTVREFLKKEKFEAEISETFEIPGIATGLAVTATGGDILFIEATRMTGKGKLILTGQLGDVMRESAQIAHSYVRSKARQLNIDTAEFEKTEVHLHVPAGAIPKDGPSAGIAMVTAIASLFSGRPVRGDVGMTGEVTLRGRVMPVGGIKMKVLAAHRAGLTTVILPRRNEGDLEDLPDEIRRTMTFVPVDQIDQALKIALAAEKGRK